MFGIGNSLYNLFLLFFFLVKFQVMKVFYTVLTLGVSILLLWQCFKFLNQSSHTLMHNLTGSTSVDGKKYGYFLQLTDTHVSKYLFPYKYVLISCYSWMTIILMAPHLNQAVICFPKTTHTRNITPFVELWVYPVYVWMLPVFL